MKVILSKQLTEQTWQNKQTKLRLDEISKMKIVFTKRLTKENHAEKN